MKREILAAALLLMLFLASVYNVIVLDRLIGAVEEELDRAQAQAAAKEYPAAAESLKRAWQRWDESRSYTHVFIRHPEIDAVADAFHALEGALAEENAKVSASAFDLLRYHLDSIGEMEHIRLGSILISYC